MSEVAESPAEQVVEPSINKPSKKRGLAGVVLVLMLLLAGAGAAGYWGYGKWQGQESRLFALQTRLDAQQAQFAQDLALRAPQDALNTLRADTQSAQQALQLAVAGVQAELGEQRQKLEALKQVIGQDADAWRLSEIERLLSAAQLRIEALDDPQAARLMLREADRLAATLGGEAQSLRAGVAQMIHALDAAAPLDREALSAKLLQLAQIMPQFPRTSGELAPAAGGVAESTAAASDWWTQTKTWFNGWFSVKNNAQPAAKAQAQADEARPNPAQQSLMQARSALLARQVNQAYQAAAQALASLQNDAPLDRRAPLVQQALSELRDVAAMLEQGERRLALDFAPLYAALRTLRTPPASLHEPVPTMPQTLPTSPSKEP